jgi:radical SAM protein with 4Fe4S-binding SPASM domain
MDSLSYSEFSRGIFNKLSGDKRIPMTGSIEVTRRCPLKCAHCYNNLSLGDQQSRNRELTYEEHCRILDEITEAGCLWLLYTGGEILARPDFLDIYTYAKQKGLLITLFTNGTLLTPEIADYLAEWRPFSIEITIYGRTKATYELVTGVPGSYERCLRGIHLVKERGLPLKLKTMAITLNKHEIWEMKKFAENDLGTEFRFDAMINPRIEHSKGPLVVRLTPDEVVALDLQDPKRTTEWMKFCEKFNGIALSPDRRNHLYQCGGGSNSFAIDPYGKMNLCLLSTDHAYDLRTGSFQVGWQESLAKVLRQKVTKQTKCFSCEIKSMCGMCPANAELENGDSEEPVDFMCQVAHLRAKALGLRVTPHGDCKHCSVTAR